jgi:uncharacterized protein YecT (DUF1311 family)
MIWLAILLMAQADHEPLPPYPPDTVCAETTTRQLSECLQKQTTVWNERLNTEYAKALAHLDTAELPALREAQRLWVKYREANCEMYAQHGGTVAELLWAGCLLEMTKQRAVELRNMD